jgi:hypothetical protein
MPLMIVALTPSSLLVGFNRRRVIQMLKRAIAAALWSTSALCATPIPADTYWDRMAVNVHIEDFGRSYDLNWPNWVTELNYAGIRYVRDGARAPSGDNQANKQTYYDREKFIAGTGVKFLSLAGAAYPYATDLDFDFTSGGGWTAFGGPNEPSCNTTSVLAAVKAYQQGLYNFILADPLMQSHGVQVEGPALTAPAGCWHNWGDLTVMSKIGDIHPYYGGAPEKNFVNYLKYARGYINSNGVPVQGPWPHGPIAASEFGYTWSLEQTSIAPVPHAHITRYMPRLPAAWMLATGDFAWGSPSRIFYYQWMANRAPDPLDPQAGYGILNNDGTTGPEFTALVEMNRMFADPGPPFTPTDVAYSVTGGTADLYQMLFQKRNGTNLLALWVGLTSWDPTLQQPIVIPPQTVTVTLPTTNVTRLTYRDDGTVRTTVLASGTGIFHVKIDDHFTALSW